MLSALTSVLQIVGPSTARELGEIEWTGELFLATADLPTGGPWLDFGLPDLGFGLGGFRAESECVVLPNGRRSKSEGTWLILGTDISNGLFASVSENHFSVKSPRLFGTSRGVLSGAVTLLNLEVSLGRLSPDLPSRLYLGFARGSLGDPSSLANLGLGAGAFFGWSIGPLTGDDDIPC